MSAINSQRAFIANYKKETCSNLSILSKIYPMAQGLAKQIFKEEALQKPTQHVFIHVSYYLACIFDAQRASKITWPVYDSKSERTYRTEFSSFITEYSKQGLLSPVVSSYFVNPGCYKVTKLLFQLSQIAVQNALQSKMKKDYHKTLYKAASDKYWSENKDFSEFIDHETDQMMSKFNKYLLLRKSMIQISATMKKNITDVEKRLLSLKKKGFMSEFIDNFLATHDYEEKTKCEVEKIKKINEPVPILDAWLDYFDEEITKMESEWNNRAPPFLESSKICQESAEALILIHTGEIDKKSYTIEYDPKSDQLETKHLEMQVNSQQKYILKNIIKDERLNFPNLIRGFVIAMCHILKNSEMGDIYKINEHVEGESRNFGELLTTFKILIDQVYNAEMKLQKSSVNVFNHTTLKELSEIPPLPGLSDLKSNWDANQAMFDSFTPLHSSKHHFNFRHMSSTCTFIKPPQPKPLVTPFHRPPGNDFLRGLTSGQHRMTNQPKLNMSQNISIISQHNGQSHETIAECCSGFTKIQIQRLLSTKKTSSSKKHKFNLERPNINVKKGGLFNETVDCGLIRSHSSPNLFESKQKSSRGRLLSIMQEDPLSSEVSGIVVLDHSKPGTPERPVSSGSSRKLLDAIGIPTMTVSPVEFMERKFSHILKETDGVDFSQENEIKTEILKEKSTHRSTESLMVKETSSNTPKHNVHPIRKTSSIEKIINRYKKVRASNVFATECEKDTKKDFKTILEERENNMNPVNVDVMTVNRDLLPDLLSPSCSVPSKSPTAHILDQLCFEIEEKEYGKPRESLGAALGVDQTFLDQFDLID